MAKMQSVPDGVVEHILGMEQDPKAPSEEAEDKHSAVEESDSDPELRAHADALVAAVHAHDGEGVASALRRAHEHLLSSTEDVNEAEGIDDGD